MKKEKVFFLTLFSIIFLALGVIQTSYAADEQCNAEGKKVSDPVPSFSKPEVGSFLVAGTGQSSNDVLREYKSLVGKYGWMQQNEFAAKKKIKGACFQIDVENALCGYSKIPPDPPDVAVAHVTWYRINVSKMEEFFCDPPYAVSNYVPQPPEEPVPDNWLDPFKGIFWKSPIGVIIGWITLRF